MEKGKLAPWNLTLFISETIKRAHGRGAVKKPFGAASTWYRVIGALWDWSRCRLTKLVGGGIFLSSIGLYLIYGFAHWLRDSCSGKLHCLNFAFVDYPHCRVINPSEHSVLPRPNYIVSNRVWSGSVCATMLCWPRVQEAFIEAFYQSISWDIN